MGRKVLLAVICWLTLSHALAEPKGGKNPGSVVAIDNESAESASRLYGPLHVYASAVPYTSNKFKGHSVIAAGSQIVPVKHSNQGLINLKDSYGKYVETHQSAYMPAYPQQFVPLQDLPPHLAQPLVSAAAPSFNFKTAPSYIYGPHSYKIQELQLSPHQASQFGSISQPLVYANDLKSFAPSNLRSAHEVYAPQHKVTITAQKSNQPLHYAKNSKYQTQYSNHQKHHSNEPSHHSNHQVYASTSQKFYENPTSQGSADVKDTKQQGSHHQSGQIQAAPAQTQITAIVNGKKTIVNLETKPPLPLLDLSLLEPLKFDNPLVPQLQHFLPRVKGATYHKLPTPNTKKGKNKEFVITKTKSYDSGSVKGKTYSEPKKSNKPQTKPKVSKPGITVKGYPNSGDYSYEINTPNHKETYNEQVVQYNKETNMKPVEYTYNEQTHKEPEVYTFVHSSKQPLKITHVEYNSDDDGPKHLVYNLSQEEDKNDEPSHKVHQPTPNTSDEDSEENDSEEDDGPPPPSSNHDAPIHHQNEESNAYHEAPKHSQHDEGNVYHSTPKNIQRDEYHHTPKYTEQIIQKEPVKDNYLHNSESPQRAPQPKYYVQNQVPVTQKHHPQAHYYIKSSVLPPSNEHHQNVYIVQKTPNFQVHHDVPLVLHEAPRQSHHLNVEHRGNDYNQKPPQESEHQVKQSFERPHNEHQVVQHFAEPINLYQPITPEYEEDIRILPTHKPHSAPIKVDPSQHLPGNPTVQTFVNKGAQEEEHSSPQKEHHSPRPPYSTQQPFIQEKSRHIIIQENQETPDEKHMHMEQVMDEMSDREENSEADFEKAYKESAFGFPAYEEVVEDVEKDIFDPDSYGNPAFKSDFNAENTPFQQFQKQDDKFPKFARLAYKDSKDNNQEDYFLDFAVHKPESYTDRIKSKVEYYKMFKKNRPDIYYGQDEDKKEKSAKFTLAPSFNFFKPKQNKDVVVKYKMAAPIKYAYDYGHEAPRDDSSAYASRPTYHKYKTHFVEPQMQYGFEPITAPLLFAESEIASAASNNSPESETPGTRKKVYSEKWYMKKTSTNSKPS